jgi:nucleoside-diphosphate-sugar epimerase
MRILVTGGTGVIGKPTVDRLVRRGHSVRLLSRDADRDAALWPERVEPRAGSVTDADTLRGAAEGCDAILHIAGIVAEDPPETTFESVNVEGTRRLLAEAERAGSPRFVYVSSLGAERGTSAYHRSKIAAERLVRGYAGSWLIVRPGGVYGPGDEVVSTLLKMVRSLPAVPVVGWGEQPFQPIWAEDLAECLVLALERNEPSAAALEVAGEEVTSTREVLELMAEVTGKRPLRVPLPAPVVKTGFEMASSLGIDTPLSGDLLTLLVEENVISPGGTNALTDVFGVQPTPLRAGLERLARSLPERLPSDGQGPLSRHCYWADIRGSELDADALFALVCTEFGSLTPEALLRVDAEDRGETRLVPGATLTMEIPMRGTIQVRVQEVENRAATAVTLEGHPLSGMIRFLVREVARDGAPSALRFEVRSYFRASNSVDGAVMSSGGGRLQAATWRSVVEEVIRRSGGEAPDGVGAESGELEAPDAERVERWAEALVQRRKREEERARA